VDAFAEIRADDKTGYNRIKRSYLWLTGLLSFLFTTLLPQTMSNDDYKTAAEVQFHTSSIYTLPQGYTAWVIRNDYPSPFVGAQGGGVITTPGQVPGQEPSLWLGVDFKTEPIKYLNLVKEYFLEGMFKADFVPQNNTVCLYSTSTCAQQ
jgi:hypothetical protein